MSGYDERLTAPLPWWLGGLALSLLLAAVLHSGGTGVRAVAPYVVVPLLVLGGLAAGSRGRIRVEEGVLHVPRARVPLRFVGSVTVLDRDGTRQVRGPLAEPLAFVATRPWLSRAVRVELADPDDDTPYWLVGTRDPQALAEALLRERARPGG